MSYDDDPYVRLDGLERQMKALVDVIRRPEIDWMNPALVPGSVRYDEYERERTREWDEYERQRNEVKASEEYLDLERRAQEIRVVLHRAQLLRQYAASGIPAKDHDRIADGALDDTSALKWVRKWWHEQIVILILVLTGDYGVGKTTAAGWLAAQERGSIFITADALGRVDRYDNKAVERLERAPLLVIDELGVEYLDAAGSYLAKLHALLNERYAHCRRTVITTNLPPEPWIARYGGRLGDRMLESGTFAHCKGPSLRRRSGSTDGGGR